MFLNITRDFRKVLKSNIYLLGFVCELIYRFDIFLPIDPEYEIVKFINDKKQKNILDIGAHKGESIRSFRIFDQDTPILAFEANPVHREYLDKCKKKYKNILIVNQEPCCKNLVLKLIKKNKLFFINKKFKTSAIAKLVFNIKKWENLKNYSGNLNLFKTPKDFR